MAVNSPDRPGKDAIDHSVEGNVTLREAHGLLNKSNEDLSISRTPSRKSTNELATEHHASTSRDTSSTDPESVRCRVFIGNLNTDKISREDLKKHFSKYGAVLGCSLHLNFGFVQFGLKDQADKAVIETHGSVLFGKRVGMCNNTNI